MKQYQSGDSSAFEVLYGRYSGRIYGFLKRRLDRREEVDEVFQMVLTKLHQSRASYDSSYPFAQWAFVLTKTVLLDHWRKASRRLDHPAEKPVDEFLDSLPSSVHTELSPSLSHSEAVAGLKALPDDQRQILQWRILDEASYQEIALRLNRSEASVRQIISRGLKKLRLSFAEDGGEK